MKILLIDDQESMFNTLKAFIAGEPDMELDFKNNIPEGFAAILKGGYDMAIVDLRVGDEWPSEKTIARLPEVTPHTCVIVWTGYDDGKRVLWLESIKAGAWNFLQKSLYLSSRELIIHAITNTFLVYKIHKHDS